ncbi:hypothetical protein [Parvibaculum sp.]|uniref:hypothetical protein n=1 Tax=Parvibaculum sp. TaxID=2024848 RepID=UPI002B68D5E7|nr:hypothetical protein [Parvibaculum sp.]HUD50758.1 hypothetical protein [Parvibaculum sp.]
MNSARSNYLAWKLKKLDVGCLFARQIANRPQDYGQTIECVAASSTPARIASSIDQRITRLLGSPKTVAAALLFPSIKGLEQLAAGLVALREKADWNLTFTEMNHPIGDLVAVGITRTLPMGKGTVPSEGLVLGPFVEFPPTRRAPVAAFEIFVGPPLLHDPKTKKPTTKANLAHIDMRLPGDSAQKMWDRSIAGRLKSLGGREDARAKAKVAFVMPASMAKKLGVCP